jgi:hypothetical protein
VEKKLLAVIVLACVLGGCATADTTASDQPRDEGTYVTGSRLPQKTTGSSSVQRVGKEDWEDGARGKQVNPQGK